MNKKIGMLAHVDAGELDKRKYQREASRACKQNPPEADFAYTP